MLWIVILIIGFAALVSEDVRTLLVGVGGIAIVLGAMALMMLMAFIP